MRRDSQHGGSACCLFNSSFVRENGTVYRENELWRIATDTETSRRLSEKLLFRNHVEVLYDVSKIPDIEVEEGVE